jgi:hypothetical protein
MMKKISIFFTVLMPASSYAGGTVGGSPGLMKEIMLDGTFDIGSLPKSYVDTENFRRAKARLSVAEVSSVPMSVNGEEIQVRKILESIVDVEISREILPDSN